MGRGRVYIVRNPLFPTLFKLGRTAKGSVEERGLNNASLPEAFELIREFECDDPERVERKFHQTYEKYRYYSQLDKRGKQTEFFSATCLAEALGWMDLLRGLTDVTEEAAAEEREREEADEKANRGRFDKDRVPERRPNFDFAEMGIPPGSPLVFTGDESVVVKVADSRRVEYAGEVYSLTAVTYLVCGQAGRSRGGRTVSHWKFKGRNLLDILHSQPPRP